MDDDSRREILQRARDTVARLDDAEHQRWLQHGPVEQPVFQEDALERWERLRLQSVEPPKAKPEPKPQPKPMKATTMDADQQRAWNDWATALISNRLDSFAEMIGAEVGKVERSIRDQHAQEIAKLQAEIESLRTERALPRRRSALPRTSSNGADHASRN